jgi:hypothetical protein
VSQKFFVESLACFEGTPKNANNNGAPQPPSNSYNCEVGLNLIFYPEHQNRRSKVASTRGLVRFGLKESENEHAYQQEKSRQQNQDFC